MAAQTKATDKGTSTTEFYTLIAGMAGILAVTAGIISADQQDHFVQLVTGILTGLGSVGAIYKLVSEYMQQRSDLKLKMLDTLPEQKPAE